MQGETVPAKRFARLSGALRASFGLVVDVALPQLCPTCREPVDGGGLCPACWSKLSFIAPPYCERLATGRAKLRQRDVNHEPEARA